MHEASFKYGVYELLVPSIKWKSNPYSIPVLPSSGKLDKRQLPSVNGGTDHLDEEGRPSTETERLLLPLWVEVLQSQAVDVQESFFDLGGSVA